MKKDTSFLNKIFKFKRRSLMALSITDESLALLATYNYGISLLHLGQDWADESAIKTFKKILDCDESTRSQSNLRLLAQGSLACAYAKASTWSDLKRREYCDLSFYYVKGLLEHQKADSAIKALAFTAKGLAYLSLSEYAQAIQAFECALKLNNSVLILLGIGDAYSKIGKDDKAIESYKKAIGLAPASGYAAYKIGNLLLKTDKKNKDQAIKFYKKAPSLAAAKVALGKLYLDDKNFESAIEEFRNATRISRKNSEAWVNIAWSILEKRNPNKTLITEGVNAAKVAVQLSSGTSQEWHRRAILSLCLVLTKEYALALDQATVSLSLDPNRSQAKYCVALCKFHLGQYEDSRKIALDILQSYEQEMWKIKAVNLVKDIAVYYKTTK